MSVKLKEINPEYVYVTIPAEYICVYHRILAMLADYGEDMLKDCKASCTERNSGVIECFNMFNAAVAARKLGKEKLAETLIKYIKGKINQIYKGKDNSTSFVFPVDENGQLKAFVSCGERPIFEIDVRDAQLYEHKFENGFDEHFRLGKEDEEEVDTQYASELEVLLSPSYEKIRGKFHPCAEIVVLYNKHRVRLHDVNYQCYFDSIPVKDFKDVDSFGTGTHTFTVVVTYKNKTKIASKDLYYEGRYK